MFAMLLQMALLGSGSGGPSLPQRPLTIPAPSHSSTTPAEIRWAPVGATFPVAAGVQITARIRGELDFPPTDPGRTSVKVEIVLPLLARNGWTMLLPPGTQLVGRVHLLRGELLFIGFETLLLPDGRSIVLPEDVFRLGPGTLLSVQEGTLAMLTVARPLRVEAFGPNR
jgi:hypothetical protein